MNTQEKRFLVKKGDKKISYHASIEEANIAINALEDQDIDKEEFIYGAYEIIDERAEKISEIWDEEEKNSRMTLKRSAVENTNTKKHGRTTYPQHRTPI